ncbi:MAG: hypothetical protein ABI806_10805 [Candidatus Solibacter sp.]
MAQVAGMAVLVGMHVEGKTPRRPVDVILYVDGIWLPPSPVDQGARATVSWMYARLGIALAWSNASPKSGVQAAGAVAIQIRFTRESTRSVSNDALAFALPYSGGINAITVIYPRIQAITGGQIGFELSLLAHVLAHEIGHVLQGTTLHSETGVMKAHWTHWECDDMVRRPLDFAPEDAQMIVRGLTAWKHSAAPANPDKKRGSAR